MVKIPSLEATYNYLLKGIFRILGPVKKSIIKTQCNVHKSINFQALKILMNDKYVEESNFFNSYIIDINKGAVWADQDFKSSNHFYNPYNHKGMYGRKNAMELGMDYYFKALSFWKAEQFNKSLFYLGAALHIIQDMTVPQHANIRLLDNHRQYETFVKHTYQYIDAFQVEKGTYLLNSIEEYIRFNARVAMKIHKKFKTISNDDERYYKVTRCALPLAKRTTAGAMVLFYRNVFLEVK